MVAVKIENVYKDYGNFLAVKNLNLEINDGEFIAILGPSGCGKSSTMRMLAGLEHISSGRISFGETVVNDKAPKDRDIAMVFENYALYPHKTVFDNIANPLKRQKVSPSEISKRVLDAAKLLEIDPLLNRKPQELSGGQKQRVAIGRAIVRQPQVFLFDEPIAHLDAKLRARMRSELKHLQVDLGITTLYVTHDQLEALSMADRVAVMHEGVLQQYGTPREIYEKPSNAWVATFVGEPQMTLLECEVIQKDQNLFLVFEGTEISLDEQTKNIVSSSKVSHLLAGVRPDKVKIETKNEGNLIKGKVFSRQLLGGDILVEVETQTCRIRAKVGVDFSLNIGDDCSIRFNSSDFCLFSKEDGKAL